MSYTLFTSESVAQGHPDKIADQISDAILDAILRLDPEAHVACECMVCTDLIVVAGEITSNAVIDYEQIARDTVKNIGYSNPHEGFSHISAKVLLHIHKQSPDIARGVSEESGNFQGQGAGDQGIMFGYACDETEELMPLPIVLSHRIVEQLLHYRTSNKIPYLRPDAKSQVTVRYRGYKPLSIDTVVLSTQHSMDLDHKTLEKDMRDLIYESIPKSLLNDQTRYFINPTGRFVIGGPAADCGLTGRKTAVDTYGGMGRNGGGSFSGKDPSKVDRSASYAARYVAKNLVAAGLTSRCEVQLAYAIGVPYPVSIKVDCFGCNNKYDEEALAKGVHELFDLTPKGIIKHLNLKRPIYLSTAFHGHFGRTEKEFTWEKTDKVDELKRYFS
ncbi:MAG: methionine adenosyltransferase [Waddliaceae bacterium]|nr:methionine adenosyltransferase [Waddliaceae bacterium]